VAETDNKVKDRVLNSIGTKMEKQQHLKSVLLCLVFLFFSLLIPDVGVKQLPAQEPQTLTLAQAIQIALQENISLKQFYNVLVSDRIDIKQSEYNFLPNLNASISGSKNYPKQGISSESVNGSVNSNLNIFNGFYDVARLNITRLGWASDTASYSWNRQSIIYSTVSQFIQVVLDSEFIRIAMDNLSTQQDQLKQIEAFEKVGNRSKVDVYQQMSDMKQSELQLLQAEQNYQVNRYGLLQILGKSAEVNIHFQSLPVDTLNSIFANQAPETNLAEVRETREDVLAQKYQIEAAHYQIRAAQSGYWPTLSLSAGAGSNYRSGIDGLDFSDQFFNDNPYFGLSLSFSMPLFDRFATCNNVQQAEIQLSTQQLNFRNLDLQISSQVQQSLLDYSTAVKQREVAHAQYEYASEALKISEERFRVGSSTYIELSQVRTNFYNAAYQRVSADYNLLLNYISIHYFSGNIDAAISIFN
jgi:outer membrane protein